MAIIGPPAKRHLKLKWRFAGATIGPLIAVFGSYIPSSTKKKKKRTLSNLDPLWQNFLGPRMVVADLKERLMSVTTRSTVQLQLIACASLHRKKSDLEMTKGIAVDWGVKQQTKQTKKKLCLDYVAILTTHLLCFTASRLNFLDLVHLSWVQ